MRAFAVSLLLALAWPAAAEQATDYASGLPLALVPGQPYQRVELPLAVHAQARPDLADVRVFNGEGVALPFAFSRGDTPVQPSLPVAVPRFPLRAVSGHGDRLEVRIEADGRLISLQRSGSTTGPAAAWLFDLSGLREPVQALALEWPPSAADVSATVRVEGSDNLRDWAFVADSALLDLRFGGQQLRQNRIAFPATRYHYLRLTSQGALPPLTASTAEPLPAAPLAPERTLEVTGLPGTDPGEYVFDLGARLVATRIALRLPQANTVAPVTWQVRDRQRDDWRDVVRTTSWRLQRNGADVASPAIETGAVPGRYWRLRVDPRAGGLGAGAPVLRLSWRPTQVVFLARGKPPFVLAFGQRDASSAQLPLASLIPGYRPGMEASLPRAQAGAAVALGGHNAPAPGQEDRRPPDWKRWLLWGVLLLGVGVLAAMARQLLRQPPPG